MNFTDGLPDNDTPLKNLLSVICGISVSPSVIILLMDLLAAKTCQKKITHFILSVFILVIFLSINISLSEFDI